MMVYVIPDRVCLVVGRKRCVDGKAVVAGIDSGSEGGGSGSGSGSGGGGHGSWSGSCGASDIVVGVAIDVVGVVRWSSGDIAALYCCSSISNCVCSCRRRCLFRPRCPRARP